MSNVTEGLLEYVGQGFWRFTEPVTNKLINRKEVELEASMILGESVVILTRHEVEDSMKVFPSERVTIFQLESDYEADKAKRISKTKN